MQSDIEQKLIDYSELFLSVEQEIKKAEMFADDVIIPAINQLRYSAHHLAKSHTIKDDKCKLEHIDKAMRHVKRARYDAAEVGILVCLQMFRDLREDYKDVSITQIFPDYIKASVLCDEVYELMSKVTKDEENGGANPRENIADRCWQDFDKLSVYCNQFKRYREELNKVLKKQRKDSFLIILGICVTIIVGAASLIVSKFF